MIVDTIEIYRILVICYWLLNHWLLKGHSNDCMPLDIGDII